MSSPEFIIWAPEWNDESGGIIALHTLSARLNELGYSAALWPRWKPVGIPSTWRELRQWAAYLLKLRFLRRFGTGPFEQRFASWRDLKKAIVIYPETLSGNPLRGRRVVRWLLYKPGMFTGVVDYGPNDFIVFYNEAFASAGSPPENLLQVSYQIPAYRQSNFGERTGSCVLVRKGFDRPLNRHPADSIPVDDLSHEERAQVLNRVRYCYCYDLYTYLSVYAALCGCTPVIVPEPGVSEEEWQPQAQNRLGLAYGDERIPWAEASRQQLRDYIAQRLVTEDSTVERFVRKTREKTDW